MGNPIILYDNRFLDNVPIATDEAPGYYARHIRDLRPFTFWRGAGSGTKYLTVSCGSAKSADALALLGHNLGTVAANVSVESSPDNFSAVNQRLAPFTPANDAMILKLFNTASEAYWRLKLVTASVAAQLAVAVLGSKLEFPSPPRGPFAPYKESVQSAFDLLQSGMPLLAEVKYHPITIDAKFQYLDRAWLETYFLPFWGNHMKLDKYFFWAWNLDDFPEHVFFVKRAKGYQFSMPLIKGFRVPDFSIQMEGVMLE
jgi:hypothetical protein